MDENAVKAMLDQLSEYKSRKDVLALEKQTLIDSVLTLEIKEKLREIDAEFSGKSETIDSNIAELEKAIRGEVKEMGATIRGKYFMAVWCRGSVTWDTEQLDGYLISHPEIEHLRKEGDPSVKIRKI